MKIDVFRNIVFRGGVIISIGLITYSINRELLGALAETGTFSLSSTYLFFGFSSLTIYLVIELFVKLLKTRSAYLFLFFTFLKIGLFIILFLVDFEKNQSILMSQKLSMIVALFVFTITETLIVLKVLKNRMNYSSFRKAQ